ncbi:MAG: tyrosine decarboxylase/aspartate 1-decarboxylase [Spirosomataceae bacterium]
MYPTTILTDYKTLISTTTIVLLTKFLTFAKNENTMKHWKRRTSKEIQERIDTALGENSSFYDEPIIGMPCSHLDSKIFPHGNPILNNAPFLQTLINNPNHIGCHTVAASEATFSGTQKVERELLNIVACDIFKAEEGEFDGYVASGGTEANMQAVWVYREFFKKNSNFSLDEIVIVCSSDTHYSIPKASNVLGVQLHKVPVDKVTRQMSPSGLSNAFSELKENGIKGIIFVANMMTTMFGSVDELDVITEALLESDLEFKLHIDGAYGGFFYPFANESNNMNFANEHVNSITVDAHKMAQAPYGTGIFLIRKGFMGYTHSKEASYVKGEDYTLVGSRSGANAVAVWMILSAHGPNGWKEKTHILKHRVDWLCKELDAAGVNYFREANSNIVSLSAECVLPEVAQKYQIVPDDHHAPKWYKIIVMEHVEVEDLEMFLADLNVAVLQ